MFPATELVVEARARREKNSKCERRKRRERERCFGLVRTYGGLPINISFEIILIVPYFEVCSLIFVCSDLRRFYLAIELVFSHCYPKLNCYGDYP